jgi:hypothetical protein
MSYGQKTNHADTFFTDIYALRAKKSYSPAGFNVNKKEQQSCFNFVRRTLTDNESPN